MKKRFLLILIAVCMIFSGCESSPKESSADFFAMDTLMRISAYGGDPQTAVQQAQNRIFELESLWSVTNANSELHALNAQKRFSVSPETAELVSFALEISAKTDGALDPTIYPILTAWGFTTGKNRVPPPEEISELLKLVDYRNVQIDGCTITLQEGMTLDLGAVAKGYASDEAARIMRENGVNSALIDLGGNIMTVGTKPDGSPWKIGVQDPTGEGHVGILSLSDRAAVTSGSYERNFTAEDGTVYGHIIDPASGYPVNNELLSATIIAANGALCDALSTATFVMGSEAAEQLWRSDGGFDMILITKNGEILLTEGLENSFSLSSSFTVRVLRK